MAKRSKSHKDVEYAVEDFSGRERIFKKFDEAAAFAVAKAASRGEMVKLDVLIYSVSGARFYGGDDAVERYREDPDASVSDRFEISVNHVGHVA